MALMPTVREATVGPDPGAPDEKEYRLSVIDGVYEYVLRWMWILHATLPGY